MALFGAIAILLSIALFVLYLWIWQDACALAEFVHSVLLNEDLYQEAKKDYQKSISQLPRFSVRQVELDTRGFIFVYAQKFSRLNNIGYFARSRINAR